MHYIYTRLFVSPVGVYLQFEHMHAMQLTSLLDWYSCCGCPPVMAAPVAITTFVPSLRGNRGCRTACLSRDESQARAFSHTAADAPVEASRRVPEEDPRYRRVDMAERYAWKARQAFARNVARGEGRISLAETCLHIAAEDDAIVSHSSVELPVQSFLARLDALVDGLARTHLPQLGPQATPGAQLQPGFAYLHEALISRTAIAAVLAVLLAHLLQQLLLRQSIDFVVRMDISALDRLPRAEILPGMGRDSVVAPDGSIINTCATEVLVEVLRYLKRAYWPFPWEAGAVDRRPDDWAGGSGFLGAAKAALEGEHDATLKAISRTAKHRQERGIWTSTGAGDLRRACAAAERLAILCGDLHPVERRDAAVLLLHKGQYDQALVELQVYMKSPAMKHATANEAQAAEDMQALLQGLVHGPAPHRFTAHTAMQTPAPEISDARRLPLTW